LNPALQRALRIDAAERVRGGCIHQCYRVSIGGATRFVKLNAAAYAGAFAAEADGLTHLQAAGWRTPTPLGHGVAAGQAYLVLEHLDLQGPRDFPALGRMLAAAHRQHGTRFGWGQDNYIGATPQHNGWSADWARFWRERRLAPQLALARKNGFAFDSPDLDHLLAGHRPEPSLLHGDLWSGNAGFTPQGPVVFDPAVYYGDREADLAMTELFGGFPAEFYAAYGEVYPLDAGYAKRKHLYNLYHLLNHLNLFGRGYLEQVNAALSLLLGA
jgi:protein-ribulosamine 3-kinase